MFIYIVFLKTLLLQLRLPETASLSPVFSFIKATRFSFAMHGEEYICYKTASEARKERRFKK